jgi:uncharacterized protein (TIGR03437 family)
MFLTRPDASERWQIASYPEGIREATISGDGRIIYAVTNSNRLLRYRVETGDVQELAPRFPFLFNDFGLGVPGSMITIFGSGLADEAADASYPLPTSLNGVSAEVAGVPLRIQKVGRDQIRAQIPFELPATDTTLRVAGPETPFAQSPTRFFVADFQPGWLTGLNGFARHDDLTRPATYTDPARPGEIVHLDLTGLGATLPPLPSGVPAPAVGAIRVARTIQGRLRGSRQEVIDLEVVAAILIPGTIGSYRVSLRIPEANKLTPDGAGFVLGTIELMSPGATGRFVSDFGAVAIRL